MVYCSAGHNPPLHWDAKGWRGVMLRAGGMALGVLPGVELENQGVRLEPGDLVVLYTDGYTEAHGREYAQFGMERFQAAVAASAAHDALEVHRRVGQALGEFVGDAPQSDDLTLVVLGREGAGLPSDAGRAHT
jgi:sigma-B regulation protein RsbU (phosphoserine phosphatase)